MLLFTLLALVYFCCKRIVTIFVWYSSRSDHGSKTSEAKFSLAYRTSPIPVETSTSPAKKRYKHCYASSHFAYSLDVLLVRHRFISFNVPRLPALLALFNKVSSTEGHIMLVDASWQSRISYTLALVRLYHASPKKAIDFSVKCQKVKLAYDKAALNGFFPSKLFPFRAWHPF